MIPELLYTISDGAYKILFVNIICPGKTLLLIVNSVFTIIYLTKQNVSPIYLERTLLITIIIYINDIIYVII